VDLLIPIALIVVGLVLIGFEIYVVPGLNIVGIIGFLLIIFAIGYLFSETGAAGGMIALLATCAVGGAMFAALWQSGAWDRFVLSTSLQAESSEVDRESETRARFLGKEGMAVTPLRPTGVAEIDGDRIEVMTQGDFIAAGSKVKVVAIDRRRYFVRLA
jgi:membrane-bound ClpP family serine protease